MYKEYMEKYYLNNSMETIKIRHSDTMIEIRPLMVAGMLKHTAKQLEKLRSKELWTISELRELENW